MFAQWDAVEIHDNVLYRRWNPKAVGHEVLQLLVPASHRHDFLAKTHQGMTGGHLGVRRTLAQVQRRAFGQDGEMMFAPFVDGAHLVRPIDVVNFRESVLFSQFWQENRLKD